MGKRLGFFSVFVRFLVSFFSFLCKRIFIIVFSLIISLKSFVGIRIDSCIRAVSETENLFDFLIANADLSEFLDCRKEDGRRSDPSDLEYVSSLETGGGGKEELFRFPSFSSRVFNPFFFL